MAGYRIEYSGGAVQRKDQPQATGASSLTELIQTTISPATWEGNSTLTNSASPGNALPAGYVQEGLTTQSASGGILSFQNAFYISYYRTSFWSAQSIGTVSYEYRVRVDSPPNNLGKVIRVRLVKVTDRVANDSSSTIDNLTAVVQNDFLDLISDTVTVGVFFIRSGTVNVAAGESLRLVFESDDQESFSLDYFRIFTQSTTPVTITPTTFTNGVNATGGSLVTPSVTTLQTGASAVTTPAKEFGMLVKHDGGVISQLKYLPPAETAEPAIVSMQDSGIITATATTISAEGEGLGGSDKLRANDTSIIVESYEDAVEN